MAVKVGGKRQSTGKSNYIKPDYARVSDRKLNDFCPTVPVPVPVPVPISFVTRCHSVT